MAALPGVISESNICANLHFSPTSLLFDATCRRTLSKFPNGLWCGKTRMMELPEGKKLR